MNHICIIGARGLVSTLLQAKLAIDPSIKLSVISTEDALYQMAISDAAAILAKADLVVLCVQDFQSESIVKLLPANKRILDISPTFRCDNDWVYGLPEIDIGRICTANRVANPGCFATSAILLIKPLIASLALSPSSDFYLDGVGGYTTGGSKLINMNISGDLPTETVYSLNREHRHVGEIRHHCGLTGNIFFAPKIAKFTRGIRMQTYISNVDRQTALNSYQEYYKDSDIVVDIKQPSKISADEWVYKDQACIRVYQHGNGCLVVCVMDNLGKGAVDSAITNINLMLSGQ